MTLQAISSCADGPSAPHALLDADEPIAEQDFDLTADQPLPEHDPDLTWTARDNINWARLAMLAVSIVAHGALLWACIREAPRVEFLGSPSRRGGIGMQYVMSGPMRKSLDTGRKAQTPLAFDQVLKPIDNTNQPMSQPTDYLNEPIRQPMVESNEPILEPMDPRNNPRPLRANVSREPTPYALAAAPAAQLPRRQSNVDIQPGKMLAESLPPRAPSGALQVALVSTVGSAGAGTAGTNNVESTMVGFHTRVEPRYPQGLLLRRIEGDVELFVTIGSDGRVAAARIFKSSGYAAFDDSAIEAVRTWRARPITRSGKPASQDVIVPLSFRIRR